MKLKLKTKETVEGRKRDEKNTRRRNGKSKRKKKEIMIN